jgi:hypothetical protein
VVSRAHKGCRIRIKNLVICSGRSFFFFAMEEVNHEISSDYHGCNPLTILDQERADPMANLLLPRAPPWTRRKEHTRLPLLRSRGRAIATGTDTPACLGRSEEEGKRKGKPLTVGSSLSVTNTQAPPVLLYFFRLKTATDSYFPLYSIYISRPLISKLPLIFSGMLEITWKNTTRNDKSKEELCIYLTLN